MPHDGLGARIGKYVGPRGDYFIILSVSGLDLTYLYYDIWGIQSHNGRVYPISSMIKYLKDFHFIYEEEEEII
jgi:hypothetical protein